MKRDDLVQALVTGKQGHNIMVYGPSGTGKTWFGLTFPKVFCFDFDGGLTTALSPLLSQDFEYETYADMKGHDAFDKFQGHWNAAIKRPEIKTFFIDSLTTLSDHIMRSIMSISANTTKLPQIQDWGVLINKLSQLFYSCIADTPDRILVVSAHEQVVDFADGTSSLLPLVVGKKLPGRLGLWFEEVYYSTCAGSKQKPRFELLTRGGSSHIAKSRLASFAPIELREPNDWRVIYPKVQQALSELSGAPKEERKEEPVVSP